MSIASANPKANDRRRAFFTIILFLLTSFSLANMIARPGYYRQRRQARSLRRAGRRVKIRAAWGAERFAILGSRRIVGWARAPLLRRVSRPGAARPPPPAAG